VITQNQTEFLDFVNFIFQTKTKMDQPWPVLAYVLLGPSPEKADGNIEVSIHFRGESKHHTAELSHVGPVSADYGKFEARVRRNNYYDYTFYFERNNHQDVQCTKFEERLQGHVIRTQLNVKHMNKKKTDRETWLTFEFPWSS